MDRSRGTNEARVDGSPQYIYRPLRITMSLKSQETGKEEEQTNPET